MRRNRIIRFLLGAFAAGALMGLVFGLIFSGGSESGTSQILDNSDTSASQLVTTQTTSTGTQKMTAELARTIGANELGEVLVLSYQQIGSPESEKSRSPENFRSDLAVLKAEGFYPITANELVTGNIDIPAGKSPVLITFDGSYAGQYRILDDESVDPDSAVGIMQAAADAGGWLSKATFFCLTGGSAKDQVLFGQSDKQQEKLKNLVEWGYEVGSYTASRVDLSKVSADEVAKQLGQSQKALNKMIGPAYSVTSLALPSDGYPSNESLLSQGEYNGTKYSYTAVLANGTTMTPSPFSSKFNALHVVCLKVTGDALQQAIDNFKKHPDLKYISDGDPTTVSAPKQVSDELGIPRTDLGRPVVRY